MRSWMIGITFGIILVAGLPTLPTFPFVCAIGVCGLLIPSVFPRMWSFFLAGLAMGSVFGIFHGQQLLDQRLDTECEAQTLEVRGVIASLPSRGVTRSGDPRQRFRFEVAQLLPERCKGPETLELSYYGDDTLRPGEHWRFVVRLKAPYGLANPGTFNRQAWYAHNGIDGTGSVRSGGAERLTGNLAWRYLHHRQREAISARIGEVSHENSVLAILRAVTVADRNGMDSSLWGLFETYGINHLLVVSGLHVGLVAALGYLLGQLPRLVLMQFLPHPAWVSLPSLMGLFFAVFYSALAGFSLPTTRALIMLSVFVLASMSGRRHGVWNSLLVAALVVLLVNPLSALASGFWLSFTAVAGLLWLGLWRPDGSRLRQAIRAHLFMSVLMVPLGGWWFGSASLVAAGANFVMVPLVGFWVVPFALLGACLQFFHPGWGGHLMYLAGWPLDVLLPLARAFSVSSGSHLVLQVTPAFPAFVLALAGVALLAPRGIRGLFKIALVLLAPAVIPRGESMDPAQFIAKLTVLDVGQGTSAVLQGPVNTLVYDTGGGDPSGNNIAHSVVYPYLRHEGIGIVDTLVVSHPDNDHSAGARTLLELLPVHQYRYSGRNTLTGEGLRCRAGQAWRWSSEISFQVLSASSREGVSTNNSSCVLQVQIGNWTVMLPGDIDRSQENTLVRYWRESLGSNVLLAAHHGSNTSSSATWLKFVQPELAIYSSGYRNSFGHPHKDVLARAGQWAQSNLNTHKEGAVEIYFSRKGEISVQSYRRNQWRFWYGEQ